MSTIADCYTLFSNMLPNVFGSYYDFAERFSNAKYTPWGTRYEGVKDAALLSKLIRKHFFVRYLKKDVLPQLPPKVFQRISLPKSYSIPAYERALKVMIDAGQDITSMRMVPTHLMSLVALQGELKIDAISEYTKDLLDQGIPCVLFARHTKVIDGYVCNLKKYAPGVIVGATTATNRERAIREFQSGTTNLMICNIDAAGVGVTLSRGEYVIMAELPFNPSQLTQATDRVNRIGVRATTNVSYFVVEGSLDERISGILVKKSLAFTKVIR